VKEIRVTPIKNGTVIDHIPSGRALKVLRILGISGEVSSTVTVAMHVPSKVMGWKDIVKVEDRELHPKEVDKIALIAPSASVNVIRNYNVAEKHSVQTPDRVLGILKCGNPNCITNQREPVETEFLTRAREPLLLTCKYCEREVEDVAAAIV
jgi:aspartate carbamoyltransferase regulatory subunit